MHHGHCYTLAPADQGVCMVGHNNLLIQTTCTVYCNIAGALGFPGHRNARTAARSGHPCLQSLAQIVGHVEHLKLSMAAGVGAAATAAQAICKGRTQPQDIVSMLWLYIRAPHLAAATCHLVSAAHAICKRHSQPAKTRSTLCLQDCMTLHSLESTIFGCRHVGRGDGCACHLQGAHTAHRHCLHATASLPAPLRLPIPQLWPGQQPGHRHRASQVSRPHSTEQVAQIRSAWQAQTCSTRTLP